MTDASSAVATTTSWGMSPVLTRCVVTSVTTPAANVRCTLRDVRVSTP